MFERFTEGARQVVVLAQEEARLLAHMHIGTEHLLLGVIRQEDDVLPVLQARGLSLENARAEVLELVPRGDETLSGQIPFTPGAKKVLELSLEQSAALNHSIITPVHLALGLVLEGDGVAARILRDHGVDSAELERALGEYAPAALRADAYARRLALVEARIAAAERRAEVMDLVANSRDHEAAVAQVADLLGIDEELALDVTNMRLAYFTTVAVEKLRQEREDLRQRIRESG